MSTSPAAVIVLAAGEGTRMRSAIPKVLHRLGGRSLLGHALVAATSIEPDRLAVVVRHEREQVVAHVTELAPGAFVVDQDDIPGTGRAVQCALSLLDAVAQADWVAEQRAHGGHEEAEPGEARLTGPVVVTAGDVPLLDGGVLGQLLDAHLAGSNAVTALSARVADPAGYGRILRDEGGQVVGVVEHRDATPEQLAIDEINASVYVFDADVLREGLVGAGRDNDAGEVYLTDVLAHAHRSGRPVQAIAVEDTWLVEGVNDRAQLAALGAELNRRVAEEWMRAGVTIVDPATTWIDVTVELARDVTLLPGTQLHGATTVGEGATVGPDTTLSDVEVGAGANVVRTHGSGSRIGEGADVGPFAYLRPGTVLGARGKIGTFVETKNSTIGDGSKVPHLSYVGDADIGEETNIGASSVFVNYDGVRKHRSTIGSGARTGSDNMFVAPVTVGDGAYTGAGTVIRTDVPPGALAINPATQRNIEGWVLRRRAGTPAAEAAQAALDADENVLSPQARAERARGAYVDGGSAGATSSPADAGQEEMR